MNIENKKQLATILLAVGLGLIASMLMSKVVNDKIDQQTKIIAKEYQGRSAALVKEIDVTKRALAKLSQEQQALAKRLAERPVIRAETPKPQKSPVRQRAAFSLRTPPGKRALTMNISSLAAVGGLVNPGDFVDIIARLNVPKETGKDSKKEKEKVITVLFQNIQVLAVGTNYDPLGNIPPYEMQQKLNSLNITFAVNPDEASLLTFAQENGDLQLALRSPGETQNKLLQQVASWDELADFVLEKQGTELRTPKKKKAPSGKVEEIEEPKSLIQIFRGGREL